MKAKKFFLLSQRYTLLCTVYALKNLNLLLVYVYICQMWS
jgi:hypothetical protein